MLANVAGVLRTAITHRVSLDDWDRVLSVNLTGTFLCCRAAIPALLDSGGNIVNVASTAALAGQPWAAAYSASKGGVLALTRTHRRRVRTAGPALQRGVPGVDRHADHP